MSAKAPAFCLASFYSAKKAGIRQSRESFLTVEVTVPNHYHPADVEEEEISPRQVEIIGRSRHAPLKKAEVSALITGPFWFSHAVRRRYCTQVSWMLLDEEFVQGLYGYLSSRGINRVAELYAGRGILRKFMVAQGISKWDAYDHCPPPGADVRRSWTRKALKGIKPGEIDALVVSWVPYEAPDDVALLRAARRLQVPLLCVGEGEGGCTNSSRFWDTLYAQGFAEQEEIVAVPVSNWDGIHDYFMAIFPPPPRPQRTPRTKQRRQRVRLRRR